MFEARLRAFQQHNNNNRNHHDTNRFAATTAIYRNRANDVLQRNKMDGVALAVKQHEQEIEHLSRNKSNLEHQLQNKNWLASVDFASDILMEKELRHQLERVTNELQIKQAQNPEQLWHARVQPLKPEHVGSLAVLSYASGNREEIFNIDPDRCSCGRIVHFECITHMDICLTCKICKKVLLAVEDLQIDLMHKMPVNKRETAAQRQQQQQQHAANTSAGVISSSSRQGSKQKDDKDDDDDGKDEPNKRMKVETETSSLSTTTARKTPKPANHVSFKRYLMQFSETAIEIPQTAWKTLYESLASIHLLSSMRCKPVPIEKILKDNHLQAFIPHSTRMAKMFNGEPVPVLSMDLIERLVQRYDELYQAAVVLFQKQAYTKISLPGKEMLAHVFLVMEQRSDLASAFTTHKTNNVSQLEKQKFWDLLHECSKTSSLSWRY